MQRDVYASLVKKRTKEFIPVRILQLSGEISHERLYDEVFEGHHLRRIVLMTHMAGSTPPQQQQRTTNTNLSTSTTAQQHGLLPHDVIVESFAKLKQLHQPHYMYKLLPLLCDSHVAFNALLGIVSSPGSPFRIEHRRDPMGFRIQFPPGSKHRADIGEALLKETAPEQQQESYLHRKLPLPFNGVDYHGMLLNTSSGPVTPSAATGSNGAAATAVGCSGTLCVVEAITETVLHEHGVMNRFVFSPTFTSRFTSAAVPIFHDYYNMCNQRFHFIATKKPIPYDSRHALLRQATHENLYIYELNGSSGNFEFAKP